MKLPLKISVGAWKILLAVLVLSALVETGILLVHAQNLLGPAQRGSLRVKLQPGQPLSLRTFVVGDFEGDSPLAQAGVQKGDSIRFDELSSLYGTANARQPIELTWLHDGTWRPMTVLTAPYVPPGDRGLGWLAVVFSFVGLCFAIVVGLRSASSTWGRALASFFVITVFNVWFLASAPGVYAAGKTAMWALSLWPWWASLVVFAIYFPDDQPTRLRLHYANWLPYFLVFDSLAAAIFFMHYGLRLSFGEHVAAVAAAFIALHLLIILSALIDGLIAAVGLARQRQRWVVLLFGAYTLLTLGTWMDSWFSGWIWQVWPRVWMFGAFAVYSGLIYSVLRHRVLDFGFAVNRAVVYTTTSTIVLLLFAASEWGLDKILIFEDRERSAVLDAGVALVIIVSFRRIHQWTDSRVNSIFFRQWHEAAAKLRTFMGQVAYISTDSALRERFIAALHEFNRGAGAALYACDPSGNFHLVGTSHDGAKATIGIDDDIPLQLRQTRRSVDFALGLAVPLLLRSRLNGIVILGTKGNGELYRPDEISQLEACVERVGLALEILRIESLEREMTVMTRRDSELQLQLARLVAENARLPPGR